MGVFQLSTTVNKQTNKQTKLPLCVFIVLESVAQKSLRISTVRPTLSVISVFLIMPTRKVKAANYTENEKNETLFVHRLFGS